MGDTPVEVALSVRAQHAEGPLWDAATARLWWVEITGERVHCTDPESSIDTSWSTPGQPGGVVLDQEGEPVVASPEGLAVLDRASGATTLRVPIEQDITENRANDVKVDERGRAWFGTMAFDKRPRNAGLYRVDADGARYTEGTIGARQVPSYVDEPGVDPNRNTETYASLTLRVDSPRWAGVPFTLRSGKALEADSAEIAIHFRPLAGYLVDHWPGVEANVLRIGLTEPYVRMATTFNGPERTAESRELEAPSTAPRFTAYAHLIQQMLNSDPMLFIRGDEAEEAWRIIDPVMQAWAAGRVPMREYAAGQPPPEPPRA